MAGYGHDTSTLVIDVTLPDARTLTVVGENDGVNGYEWSARLDDETLPVTVDERVLIDGIHEPEED